MSGLIVDGGLPEYAVADDARALRDAFGAFATGVAVITTLDVDGRRWGLTANSFGVVSEDPPVVMWSLARTSASHGAFAAATHFAVHVLGESQSAWSRRFASRVADRFEGLTVVAGAGGAPLLEGCAAALECVTLAAHAGGDHTVFVARVSRASVRPDRPLVFCRGRYGAARPAPAA